MAIINFHPRPVSKSNLTIFFYRGVDRIKIGAVDLLNLSFKPYHPLSPDHKTVGTKEENNASICRRICEQMPLNVTISLRNRGHSQFL